MLPLDRNGQTAKMVVNEVIMIAFTLSDEASMTARSRLSPALRIRLIVSIFRMESFMTMPVMTIRPIIDIRLMLTPKIHRTSKATKTSTTISERMISGWTRDSNWEARIR